MLSKKITYYLKSYALFCCLAFIQQSCQKPADSQPTACYTCLPDITTSGKVTFGCRVNGKVWLPQHGSFMGPEISWYINNNYIYINTYQDNDDRVEWIDFAIGPIRDTGTYQVSDSSLKVRSGSYAIDNRKLNTYLEYHTDSILKGAFHFLRFDKIWSGTFSFDLYDMYHQRHDTIHITDGRFDL